MGYEKMVGIQKDKKSLRIIQVNGEGQLVPAPSTETGWLTCAIPNGGTNSTVIDLGGYYTYLKVSIPTVDSCTLKLQSCQISEGGTFQDVGASVTTATTTGAYNDTWNLFGWRFVRIVASAGQTAERVFQVQGITF